MNSIKKIRLILTLCSLLIASVSVNAQVVIKDCGGGVTVGGNDVCPGRSGNRGGLVVYPVPDRWGAIAVDTVRQDKFGYDYSFDGQSYADEKAVDQCGQKGCEVVLRFKNRCGAVAGTPGAHPWVLTGGVALRRADAEKQAMAECERQRQARGVKQACILGVRANCAGSPK